MISMRQGIQQTVTLGLDPRVQGERFRRLTYGPWIARSSRAMTSCGMATPIMSLFVQESLA